MNSLGCYLKEHCKYVNQIIRMRLFRKTNYKLYRQQDNTNYFDQMIE
jgi:hypothetical protein